MSKITITSKAVKGVLIASPVTGDSGFIMVASGSYEEFELDNTQEWEIKTKVNDKDPLLTIAIGCEDTLDLTYLLI